jgi:hypothetical protein
MLWTVITLFALDTRQDSGPQKVFDSEKDTILHDLETFGPTLNPKSTRFVLPN